LRERTEFLMIVAAWWIRPDHLPRWRELFEYRFAPA
jgi:hypothetical protein